MPDRLAWPQLDANSMRDPRAVLSVLIQSETLSAAALLDAQMRQLGALAAFAAPHSPHFKARLDSAGLNAGTFDNPDALSQLPLLTRAMLQQDIARITSDSIPDAHLPFNETQTSGSTGEPVKLRRSAVSQAFWLALTMREHLWHKRDFTGKLAVLRANLDAAGPVAQANWGIPVSLFTQSGPAFAMRNNTPIRQQRDWLNEINPHYLLVYPNNLDALLDECETGELRLTNLRQIRSIGETLSEHLRQRSQALLGVTIADTYSSQELGVIAVQCPVSGFYHTMENLIVEVLNDQGRACAEGEIGRVVVTDLHNYATPLLRYDIGDYAEMGAVTPCACGRGLSSLRRIIGRERQMLRMANGDRHWPLVGFHHYREIAPIRQYQLTQRSLDEIEVRLVVSTPLDAAQEEKLTATIRTSLNHDFRLNFVYLDEMPRPANGKFEEFICAI